MESWVRRSELELGVGSGSVVGSGSGSMERVDVDINSGLANSKQRGMASFHVRFPIW